MACSPIIQLHSRKNPFGKEVMNFIRSDEDGLKRISNLGRSSSNKFAVRIDFPSQHSILSCVAINFPLFFSLNLPFVI